MPGSPRPAPAPPAPQHTTDAVRQVPSLCRTQIALPVPRPAPHLAHAREAPASRRARDVSARSPPRADRSLPGATTCATKASTTVVLPMPASPVANIVRRASCNACIHQRCSCTSSISRPMIRSGAEGVDRWPGSCPRHVFNTPSVTTSSGHTAANSASLLTTRPAYVTT